jgi:hypothetical protein
MFERMGGPSIEEGRVFTAAEIESSMAGIDTEFPVPKPHAVTQSAAEEGVKALGQLKALWEGIKNSIFTHLLAHTGELVALVRNIARTAIGAYNPQWAAADNSAARARAEEDAQRLTANIRAHEKDLLPYMRKSKHTDTVEYMREVVRTAEKGDLSNIRALGLSYTEFMDMLAVNGFAIQNARKLAEIDANRDVTMGLLKHQTAWTGGTSNPEMQNASLEGYYAALWRFRDLADRAVFDAPRSPAYRVNGMPLDINPEFGISNSLVNAQTKNLLAEVSDRYTRKGRGDAQIPAGVSLSSVLPKIAGIASGYPSVTEAVSAWQDAGITLKDIQGAAAYTAYLSRLKEYKENSKQLKELARVLEAAAQHIEVPLFTPEGQRRAAEMAARAQNTAGAQLNSAEVRRDLTQKIMDRLSVPYEEAVRMFVNSSEGKVFIQQGSDRELKFEITVRGTPSEKPETFSGTVDNKGGMSGTHFWSSGGIVLENFAESRQPAD